MLTTKGMRALNFTGSKTASTLTTGFFEKFSRINAEWDYISGILYAEDIKSSWGTTLSSLFYGFKTTDNEFSLASYFNTSQLIGSDTSWNFGGSTDYIRMTSFSLASNEMDAWNTPLGHHSFENDILNLGDGADYLMLELGQYIVNTDYASGVYKDFNDETLDGGFRVTANGGNGNDRIEIAYRSDYVLNKKVDEEWTETLVVPVATINGDSGNDLISIRGLAGDINGGTGSDIIRGDVFSDKILGGTGNDVIIGAAEDYANTDERWDQLLSQKDIITGGPGRDTFRLEQNNSYGFNGDSDFAIITDFKSRQDRISSVFYRGDLLMDRTDGSISISDSFSYGAQIFKYTARVYLDLNDNGTLEANTDELLLYVCGDQPIASDFRYAT